ncbi:MAG TPA: MFS transporter [Anaerolineales bacterium]|nr:MFS transporter [Anaerolineales bacterium]
MSPSPGQTHSIKTLQRPLFLWSLPFTFLYFSLPIISKSFGASAFEIGGLFTIFTVTTLLLRPIVGWLLDLYGRKIFLVIALLIYAMAMGVFAFSASLNWLYLARCIQGVGSAFLWATVNTIVADLTPVPERGKTLGQLNETTTRGGLIGIFAASVPMFVFPQDNGWKIVFIGYAVLTLVGAGLAWKNVPVTKPVQRRNQRQSILSRPLLKLLFIVFITGIPEAMLSPIYLIYLQDKFTTDMMTIAWAFFPAALVAAFLSSRLGAMSDRFGRASIMAIGLAGSGIFSLFMPVLPSVIWLAVLYTLSTIMWGLSEPAETAMVAELAGDDKFGVGYGVYDFVENLGFAIGPLVGGILYDTVGTGMPFYLNGIILILSAGWVLLFLRQK